MKIKIFGKENCAKCKTTKNKVEFFITKWDAKDKVDVSFHNLDTMDGMVEGAFHNVLDIPVTLLEKDNHIVARWDGEIPHSEKLKEHLFQV
ncbi:MAG: hypothetical protein DRP78_01495 [Candidatus Omnitrophota bacterium]|nr:MAG: hypothetical protein DRP78_01495 [Candidatus Omnitrophota bacterium]